MAHLKDRFCLVPFSDLTDCPEGVHHAIGSPHFDPQGNPTFPDPVVVAVMGDLMDPTLPRCSALAVSCNTRPYQSYGPLMRSIFEKGQPHKYGEFRRGLEGVMEVGEIEEINPGSLEEQTERIYLACVSPMTGTANWEIIREVLRNLAKKFSELPLGSSLRMPLIGTGAARHGESTEEVFRETIYQILMHFTPALLPSHLNRAPRRLLLFHPFEYESQLIGTMLAEKAVFLTILDKLGIFTFDRRQVYGLALGEKKENCLVEKEAFPEALEHYNRSIDYLLKGDRRKALKEASRGAEKEPNLRGIYQYISSFAEKKEGLLNTITREALNLAREGRISEAFCLSLTMRHLGGGEREEDMIHSLKKGYIHYSLASLDARLLYENYMEAGEKLQDLYQGKELAKAFSNSQNNTSLELVQKEILQELPLKEEIAKKISLRTVENSFHIVIRKIMAAQREISGARRALDNIQDLANHGKISLEEKEKNTCKGLYDLLDLIKEKEKNKAQKVHNALKKTILERLLDLLPTHGTLCLELGRAYLKDRGKNLSRKDILEGWKNLEKGYQHHPGDYGILSYLGFIICFQGNKSLGTAKEFYTLLGKILDDELQKGSFSQVQLKVSQEKTLTIPHRDPLTRQAHQYYEKYRENVKAFQKMLECILRSESTAALSQYRKILHSFEEVGRYDLAQLYEEILGEDWVQLLCKHSQSMGSIPTPFGEISLDFMVILYRKVKYWWKFSHLQSSKARKAMNSFIEKMGKKL